ncbi:hypothetical protein DFH06DRAFT_460499 [Mycena polygramma]|nr:hypothetical protein DFH06DRAFT_460499 [Mycena polygramma]
MVALCPVSPCKIARAAVLGSQTENAAKPRRRLNGEPALRHQDRADGAVARRVPSGDVTLRSGYPGETRRLMERKSSHYVHQSTTEPSGSAASRSTERGLSQLAASGCRNEGRSQSMRERSNSPLSPPGVENDALLLSGGEYSAEAWVYDASPRENAGLPCSMEGIVCRGAGPVRLLVGRAPPVARAGGSGLYWSGVVSFARPISIDIPSDPNGNAVRRRDATQAHGPRYRSSWARDVVHAGAHSRCIGRAGDDSRFASAARL